MGAWDLGRPNFDDTTWQVAKDTTFPGRCYFFQIYVAFLQFIYVYISLSVSGLVKVQAGE